MFQVFPRVTNHLLLNIDVSLYSIYCYEVKKVIYAILDIYLSEKMNPNLILLLRSVTLLTYFNGLNNKVTSKYKYINIYPAKQENRTKHNFIGCTIN